MRLVMWATSGTAAADTATDTLYLVEGNDINIEVSSGGDGIRISSTASGGSGDITDVFAGNGMTGGSSSGAATITLGTPGTLTASTSNNVSGVSHTHQVTGFGQGDITNVYAGNGMTGGASSGSATLTLGTPGDSSPSTSNSVSGVSHTHRITGTGGGGTVTNVLVGNGMDFSSFTTAGTITMGTPSTLTQYTSNSVSSASHTHEVTGLGGGGGSGTVSSSATSRGAYYSGATTVSGTTFYGSNSTWGSTSSRITSVATSHFYSNGSTVQFTGIGTSWGGRYASFNSSGTLTSYSSSRRYKENIEDLTIDTSKVFDLTARQFKYKDTQEVIHFEEDDPEPEETITNIGPNSFGYIAEEIYEHIPELVALNNNGEPDAVNYALIGILLVEEVKKLRARIEVLEGN